jgi:8-oxo-dGTP pyrophosphatase MutT (NUDIX family)
MLLRDIEGEPQFFLVRRTAKSAFAPDAYVFPGGTVDLADTLPALHARIDGTAPRETGALFRETRSDELPTDVEHPGPLERASIVAAALRELFEESGILMAFSRDDAAAPPSAQQREEWRAALRSGRASFLDILEKGDLIAAGSSLALFSHWVTPPAEPRRYDTYFFMAIAPPKQDASADRSETHDGRWISAREALAEYRRGAFNLVYPTVKHLERMLDCEDNSIAMRLALTKPVVTIQPTTHPDRGFVMPPQLENVG